MYIGETLSLEMLDDGIAEINFNNRIVSVNKFNRKTLNELRSAIELLKNAKGVGGLLLTSSKSVFVVGADITEFSVMFDVTSEEFVEEADGVNQLFS
jgi:3-hydroxyacyl-CoA dehydrogenase/enoyl-CoA hydratase/3-hydroxybutyryl-CoA epimerase/enoyl-CoA isomerase